MVEAGEVQELIRGAVMVVAGIGMPAGLVRGILVVLCTCVRPMDVARRTRVWTTDLTGNRGHGEGNALRNGRGSQMMSPVLPRLPEEAS